MEIRAEQGDILEYRGKAIVVNLFEGVTKPEGATGAADRALDGAIAQLIADGEIRGRRGEITVVHTFGKLPAGRVVVAGLGKAAELSADRVRDTAANVARLLRRSGFGTAATVAHGAGAGGLDAEASARAIAEGTLLGLYRFDRHQKADENRRELQALTIVERDAALLPALERGISTGRILAEATNFARDLANEPSNYLTPAELAARARAVADATDLRCEVLDTEQMVELGMGALLGVAKGSAQPPAFIVLHYRGDPSSEQGVGLIGKGITFDTGGISIKPAANMHEMKGDMSGGAAVIAALSAIARLKPAINVTGIVPATENMPGGNAIKPGDVLRAMNGTTIEVINTDAEGRLILADGLSYARRLELSPLIDVATLTGAITTALGDVAMGIMGNDQPLIDRVIAAGKEAGEKVWQLPMFEEYRSQIDSDVADIKNTGGRKAGSITAAMFLREFVEKTPWAHIDMAGVDTYEHDKGWITKGASGIPVRTLVHTVLSIAAERQGAGRRDGSAKRRAAAVQA
ncbi:MAG TPA: leucyl aminopeptidase [Dehalococcoidia bacterium]|nr:leucyl aminopeptidase [Dehalococcoidia bacterium]